MSAADRLIGKTQDYEVLAASHSEREALVGGGEHLAAATAFTVPALVMREPPLLRAVGVNEVLMVASHRGDFGSRRKA